MKMKIISLVMVTMAMLFAGMASANGLGEDTAWKFESPWMKSYKLQSAVVQEKLSNGAYAPPVTNIDCGEGDGCQFGDKVAGNKNTGSNCINCIDYDVNVSGDNNTVTENDVNANAANNKQANGTVNVGVTP